MPRPIIAYVCIFDGPRKAEELEMRGSGWNNGASVWRLKYSGDQDVSSMRILVCCKKSFVLPHLLPHLRPPPPGDQSQSALTSHICQLSTRLQTLSEAVFAAACGCGRLEDHARTDFDAARSGVLRRYCWNMTSVHVVMCIMSSVVEGSYKHVVLVSWPV